MSVREFFQKPLSFVKALSARQKVVFAALILAIILLTVGFFALSSKTSTTDNSYKTWKILFVVNTKDRSMKLQSLSLLSQTIRPDYRIQKFSPYKLVMLDGKNNTLYQTGIPVIDDISDAGPNVVQNINNIAYAPWKDGAIKIEITKGTKVMLDIPLAQKTSLQVVPQSFAQNISRTDQKTCGPLQVTLVNDNYTNTGKFQSDVQNIENIFRTTSPYSTMPNMFTFKEIDQPQNYGCETNGLVQCFGASANKVIELTNTTYPGNGGTVVLTDSTNGPPPGLVRGISSPGSGVAFFSNYPDTGTGRSFVDVAPHEFEGHAIGWLYDIYVFNTTNYGTQINDPSFPKTNCTNNPAGESWWKAADPNVQITQGCSNTISYGAYSLTCPGSAAVNAISGGNPISLMSALGCTQGQFSPVESYWIAHNILPEFSACPTPTQTAAAIPPSSTPVVTTSPAPSNGRLVKAFVFMDTNNNYIADSGESGLAGATITLVDTSGHNNIQTTDSSGIALFPGIVNGTYKISYTANLGAITFKAQTSFTMSGNDVTTQINFPIPGGTVSNGSPTPTGTGSVSGTPTSFPTSACHLSPNCVSGQNSVQLCTLQCDQNTAVVPSSSPAPSTPSLPPGNYCLADSVATGGCQCPDYAVDCQSRTCSDAADGTPVGPNCGAFLNYACQGLDTSVHCVAKPVIYLYPTKDTLVNVKLDIPGHVTVSIPEYPTQTGWQNVLVHPDGSLVYQNKQYHELYYESAVTGTVTPTTGILVPSSNLQQELSTMTTKLGFLPNEQQEFLQYWLPKLQKLNSNYIFVSLLSQQQKDILDKVTISPQPDTMIEYLFTFKPVSQPFTFTPWILPPILPVRSGFTAVEWGGTIINQQQNDIPLLQNLQ